MKTPVATESRPIKLALTRREAAAALGVSPMTLDRLTRRKLLSPTRANRRPLYPLAELERFLWENRAETPRTPRAAAQAHCGRAPIAP